MLQHAFKEWAVICEALGQGKQSIILRKGGIAEPEGEFGVAETRFWLYPTFVHQQDAGIQDDLRPLLEQVKSHRPPEGRLRLQYWAEVSGGYHLRDEVPALLLSHLHFWAEETVRQRFHYRTPGFSSSWRVSMPCRSEPTNYRPTRLPKLAELEKSLPIRDRRCVEPTTTF